MAWPSIFFSLRYAEAKAEALELQAALEAQGISSYICQTMAGKNIVDDIVSHLEHAKLAVIMGSETYGAQGTTKFTTKQELNSIVSEEIPFVLVKMCKKFAEFSTRFKLPEEIAYVRWDKGTSMPGNLVAKIKARLRRCSVGGADAVPPSPGLPLGNIAAVSAGAAPDAELDRLQVAAPSKKPRKAKQVKRGFLYIRGKNLLKRSVWKHR